MRDDFRSRVATARSSGLLGDRDNATGVGLGLALSRGLTEAMGGTLSADDTPGGGLTMTVALPAAAEPMPPRAEADTAGTEVCAP